MKGQRGWMHFFASLVVVTASIVWVDAPAHAYPTRDFNVYGWDAYYNRGNTNGSITWYNRTARIEGAVSTGAWIEDWLDHTTAYFEAYAGATKIDSTTWTAGKRTPEPIIHFTFTIGDTDLVGGINRIKITVCDFSYDGSRECGDPVNYSRPT
jgi:hypothetical protein